MTYESNCTLSDELLEQNAEEGFDVVPELIRTIINAAMQLERQNHLGVGPYERSPDRRDQANGYKPNLRRPCHRMSSSQFMPIFRKYEDDDLEAVLSAWENASRVAHPFLTEEFLAQERKNVPELYMPIANTWVVEADGRVIGFIALIGNEVGAIFLQPEYHGQ